MRATLLPILLHEVGLGYHHTSDWQIFSPDGRRKYLNAAERQRFLDASADEKTSIRALCTYLVFSGCRVSEALALKSDHIEIGSKTVIIRTLKRRKLTFRQIPVPQPLLDMLLEIAPGEGPIWPVHRTTAWRWVRRVMERAAISGPMACCRGTRHAFAIHAASRRIPGNLLQRWLGHATFDTTAVYLDAVGEDERGFAARMWNDA